MEKTYDDLIAGLRRIGKLTEYWQICLKLNIDPGHAAPDHIRNKYVHLNEKKS